MIKKMENNETMESLLQTLKPEESDFCANFLRDLFVNQKTQIVLSETEIPLVQTLIQAATLPAMKNILLSYLEPKTKRALLETGPFELLCDCFSYHQDYNLLLALYQKMTPSQQKQVMTSLYNANPTQYQLFKALIGNPITENQGPVMIQKARATMRQIKNEIEYGLNLIHPPTISHADMQVYSKKLVARYDADQLAAVVNPVIESMITKNLPLQNAAHFKTYLKIMFFMAPLIGVISKDIKKTYHTLLKRIADALIGMDPVWIEKILGQLPMPFITSFVAMLRAYQDQRGFDHADKYCKLFSEITTLAQATPDGLIAHAVMANTKK